MMLPLLWPVGLALPGEQDRALHALGVSETANATSLPKLSKQACLDQLNSLPNALVEPESGLIWCPNSKAGTTTMTEILQNKLDPGANLNKNCGTPEIASPQAPKRSVLTRAQ